MLFKKTIIVWANDETELIEAVADMTRLGREHPGVTAFGLSQESYAVEKPEADEHFDETVADLEIKPA